MSRFSEFWLALRYSSKDLAACGYFPIRKLISPRSRLLGYIIVFAIGAEASGAGRVAGRRGVTAGGAASGAGAAVGVATGTVTDEDFLWHPHDIRSTRITA